MTIVISDFEAFYSEHSQSTPALAIGQDGRGGLGLFAKEDLNKGQDIIKVPFNLMITAERVKHYYRY